jgi:hypothetical protein
VTCISTDHNPNRRGEVLTNGRSLRCARTSLILVHPGGDTDLPYVHWTDLAPTGRPWMDYAVRNEANGRLIVPRDWASR